MIFSILQAIANGFSMGSLYALIAVGYSMVFGVLKFVNFAHGEIFMLGTYFVMSMGVRGVPLWCALPVGMIAAAFVSVFVNKYIYRKLGEQARLSILISAVCVSLFLQNFVQVFFSPNTLSFPFSLPEDIWILPGDVVVREMDAIITGLMLFSSFIFWGFVRFTKIGLGIRAMASNMYAARVVGIPIYFLSSVTFFMGALLATMGGALQGMAFNQIMPMMGVAAGLKAFAAAVLGGIGSIWGAVCGGLILGLCESLLIEFGFSFWKDALSFVFLIILLLVRPQGLFGQKQIIKV